MRNDELPDGINQKLKSGRWSNEQLRAMGAIIADFLLDNELLLSKVMLRAPETVRTGTFSELTSLLYAANDANTKLAFEAMAHVAAALTDVPRASTYIAHAARYAFAACNSRAHLHATRDAMVAQLFLIVG